MLFTFAVGVEFGELHSVLFRLLLRPKVAHIEGRAEEVERHLAAMC